MQSGIIFCNYAEFKKRKDQKLKLDAYGTYGTVDNH